MFIDCSLRVNLYQLLLLTYAEFFALSTKITSREKHSLCNASCFARCSIYSKHWMICKSLTLGCISSRMIGNNTKNGSTCNGVNGSYSSNRNITVSASQTIITRLCSTCHLSLKLFQTVNKTVCPLIFFAPGGYWRKHRQWKNKSSEVFQAKLIGGSKLRN